MDKKNLFGNILIDKDNEQFYEILKSENVRIETIVSNGQKSEKDFWYDQDENEFVMLLEGSATLEFKDKKVEMIKGDYINIPKHCKHRVSQTSKTESTIWLAVFY